jgi:D-arabinose 1-dehydrogenase-like Zn-dependent alcohol dehydrogenase
VHQVSRAAIQTSLSETFGPRVPLEAPPSLSVGSPAAHPLRYDWVLLSRHAIAHRRTGVKAVVYDRYGGPDELRVVDLPLPAPAAGQVRQKVAATSVNLSDWECLRGSPAYARIAGPLSRRRRTLGSDIAGVVDDVGEGVAELRVGDHVYGDGLVMKGGFAEYAVVPQAALARKPAQLTFAKSSTAPPAKVWST